MVESIGRLIYALVLAIIGLLLVTFSGRIAELRNRHIHPERDRWGEATPRRYLVFGLVFLVLAIVSLMIPPW